MGLFAGDRRYGEKLCDSFMPLAVALRNLNLRWYTLRGKDLDVYITLRDRLYHMMDSIASKRRKVQLKYREKSGCA